MKRMMHLMMIGGLLLLPATASAGHVIAKVWQDGLAPIEVAIVDGDALNETAVSFYDFRSDSAHTGYEQADTSILFLYTYAGELSLFNIHHIEAGGEGAINQTISGLPAGWTFDVKDDAEGSGLAEEYTIGATTLTADWEWRNNTDGGLFGLGNAHDLIGSVIAIDTNSFNGLQSWEFLNDGGATALNLDLSKTTYIGFQPIPEPASAIAGVLGLGGLAFFRRRLA
jgi:hypothetical protein